MSLLSPAEVRHPSGREMVIVAALWIGSGPPSWVNRTFFPAIVRVVSRVSPVLVPMRSSAVAQLGWISAQSTPVVAVHLHPGTVSTSKNITPPALPSRSEPEGVTWNG